MIVEHQFKGHPWDDDPTFIRIEGKGDTAQEVNDYLNAKRIGEGWTLWICDNRELVFVIYKPITLSNEA